MKRPSYPHSSMKSSSDLVILLETGAAAKDLWKPELSNSTLHMLNASLDGCRSTNPLRGLAPNTTDHVGMSECLGCTLGRLRHESGGHWLRDARMKRGGSTGYDSNVNLLFTSSRASCLACRRSDERVVVAERRSHCNGGIDDVVDKIGIYVNE